MEKRMIQLKVYLVDNASEEMLGWFDYPVVFAVSAPKAGDTIKIGDCAIFMVRETESDPEKPDSISLLVDRVFQ